MAPNAFKISKYAAEVAELQDHALHLQQFTNPNIAFYARAHNYPNYYRLRRLYLNKPTRSDRKPPNYRLSEEQDLALEHYLDAIDAIGWGIYRSLVTQQAYALLEVSHVGLGEAPPPLGKNWGQRWLKHHPKYRHVKAKPTEIQRKLAQEEPEALRRWFTRL
ncbi:hypothetical protein CC86DRAFT_418355 [Ophiobolus disseminans]|uniref:HTH CENPB-type domain-containing protein n=1 Tax=Ophiobolus disseminans TaxID=1469910 RepID=A0A6A6ZZF2_9PLEO|nr:hypothetical protein CC86DRAFT_418355 [Ophiobolus disseminans]